MSSDAMVRRPRATVHEMVDIGTELIKRFSECDICGDEIVGEPVARCFCLFYVMLVFCSERCQRIHLTEPDDFGVMGHDPNAGKILARMYREEVN